MSTDSAPCIHYASIPHSLCLIGRDAPTDCNNGCAGYLADIHAALSLEDSERTRCEIWSRVMGYLPGDAPGAPGIQSVHGLNRPVSSWNAGKQQEHRDRTPFREE